MSRRNEFLRMYGHEIDTYYHPKIAELLFYNGRSIITGTKGVESAVGGDPFLGFKSTIFMRTLWCIKNSEDSPLTYKHLSHYLGDREHSISKRLNYAKLSPEFNKRVKIIKNGKVKLKCIDSTLFPDNDDVNGFKQLALLIKNSEDHDLIIKKEKPIITASNRYDTLFTTVIDWIRHCDGKPIITNRKRIIDDKEYGISIDEISENTGWTIKNVKDELLRISKTMVSKYIRSNLINGTIRYYMTSEGRSHTLNQFNVMAKLTWDDGRLKDKIKCSSIQCIQDKKIPVNA